MSLPAELKRKHSSQTAVRSHTPLVEVLEGRTLLSTSVLIGGAAAKAVVFTDPTGIQGTILITGGGGATVTFNGTNLSQAAGATGVVVSGSNVTLGSIAVTSSGIASTLRIATRGRGSITADAISTSGAIGSIIAPTTILNGDLTIPGFVSQITLAGAQNGTLTIGAARPTGGASLSIGSLVNENLTSTMRINSLVCGQWINTPGKTLQAPQIVSLISRGTFDPDVTLDGIAGGQWTLRTISAGTIDAGTWTIAGNVQSLNAGTIGAGWTASISGSINSMGVSQDATVDLTALSVGSLVVRGTLSDSSITLNQPLTFGKSLTSLTVGGGILSTTVRSVGNIGSVSALRMADSSIYAGVSNQLSELLPATLTDFTTTAQIGSVVLRRSADASFFDSAIAAYSLSNVSLGTVALDNAGTSFGVAAHSLKSITLVDQDTKKSAHQAPVPSTDAFSNVLIARGITTTDFEVRVI